MEIGGTAKKKEGFKKNKNKKAKTCDSVL